MREDVVTPVIDIPTPDGLFPKDLFDPLCILSQGVIAKQYDECQESYMNLMYSLQYLPTQIARLEKDLEETKALAEKEKSPALKQKVQDLHTMLREKNRDIKRFTQDKTYYVQKLKALEAIMTDNTREILAGERTY